MGWFGTSALIFVGAGIGANLRYWVAGWAAYRWGLVFPWGTMLVNVSGSLAIGLFLGLALRETWAPEWRLFIALGVLGGYTTFSTFSYETLALITQRSYAYAALNMAGSVLACLLATWIGLMIAKLLTGAPA